MLLMYCGKLDKERGKIKRKRYIQGFGAGMTHMLGFILGESVFCWQGCPQQSGIIHRNAGVIHRYEGL